MAKVQRDENGNFWNGSAWTAPFHIEGCKLDGGVDGCVDECPVLIATRETVEEIKKNHPDLAKGSIFDGDMKKEGDHG